MCRLLTLILFILLLLPHPTARAVSAASGNGVMAAYADEAPVAAAQAMLNPQLMRSSGAGYAYYRNFDPNTRDLEETVAGLMRASLDSETAAMYEVANFAADSIQIALNLASLIPVVGNLADLANSGISEARGDHETAYDYRMSAIPGAGVAYDLGQLAGTVYAHAEMAFGNCFVAGTPVLLGDGENSLPIEQLDPGMRVRTAVEGEYQDSSSEIVPSESSLVVASMDLGDGGRLTIRTIMARAELEAVPVSLGDRIYINLDELQLFGYAQVLSLENCPPIASGAGRVVLTTVETTERDNVATVRLSNGEEIECSGGHPFWSDTRQDWIPASELLPRERLRTATGETLAVDTVLKNDVREILFNLEVEGDHRYFAGDDQVLVHNVSKWFKQKSILRRGSKNGSATVKQSGIPAHRAAKFNRPGYRNYQIQENIGTASKPNWKTFYHGYVGPNESVGGLRGRHSRMVGPDGRARFNRDTDRIVVDTRTRSYGEARLIEHYGIIQGKTNVGRLIKSGTRRGNNQGGIQPAKLREYIEWEGELNGQ